MRKEIHQRTIQARLVDTCRIGQSAKSDRLNTPLLADLGDQPGQRQLRVVFKKTHKSAVKTCKGIQPLRAQITRQTIQCAQIVQQQRYKYKPPPCIVFVPTYSLSLNHNLRLST